MSSWALNLGWWELVPSQWNGATAGLCLAVGVGQREEMPVQGLAIGHYWRGKFIDPLSGIQRGGLHRERKITVNF